MTDKAVIEGSYSDLKFVKTRSVCQLVIEVPIENGARVVEIFGAPQPGGEVRVAIARLNAALTNTETPAVEASAADQGPSVASAATPAQTAPTPQVPRRAWSDLSYAEQAGIRCTEPRFVRFLQERAEQFMTTDDAVDYIRKHCSVGSRAQITKGSPAGTRWNDLERAFQAWLNTPVTR